MFNTTLTASHRYWLQENLKKLVYCQKFRTKKGVNLIVRLNRVGGNHMQSTTIEVLPTSEFREAVNDYLFCHTANAVQTVKGVRIPPDFYTEGDEVDESEAGEILLDARFGGYTTENKIYIDILVLASASRKEKLVRFTSEYTEIEEPTSFPDAFHWAVLYMKDTYKNDDQEMALACLAGCYCMCQHFDYLHDFPGDLEDCSLVVLSHYEEWLKTR
jgi:hypothetical protein